LFDEGMNRQHRTFFFGAFMATYKDEKHKQHYVWRYYLDSWSDKQQIFCLRDGRIFKANIKDLAQERDFYQLQELNAEDLKILNAFIDTFPVHLQAAHRGLLEVFSMPHRGKSIITGLERMFDLSKHLEAYDLKRTIKVMINNLEEELHSDIESQSIKFISDIRSEDASFWDNADSKLNFLQFVSLQMVRTKKMQNNIYSLIEMKMPEHQNLKKLWGAMRHMISMNLAHATFSKTEYGLRLLLNDSNVPFITSDQPVVNTFSEGLALSERPEKFEMYYPLSPKKAILITEKEDGIDFLEAKEVERYNECLFSLSHEQVYSSSEKSLERFLPTRS
jgi:hypothetical protein